MSENLDLFGGVGPERESFQAKIRGDGCVCPVCDRWAKVYGRTLNATMVRALMWIWSLSNNGLSWVDVPKEAREGQGTYDHTKQYSTLKYWGFLDHKPNVDDPTQKESGIWKPTEKARAFLLGEPVPDTAYTYNDEVLKMGTETVQIHEIVLGFDYRQIMRPVDAEFFDTLTYVSTNERRRKRETRP